MLIGAGHNLSITGNAHGGILTDATTGTDTNAGHNTLIGLSSPGTDTFVVDHTNDAVTETNVGTTALVSSSVSFDLGTATNVNNLILTGAGTITGTGNTLHDVLTSSSTGTDALIGKGTTGNDTFYVNHAGDTVTETGNGTANLVSSTISFTLGANLQDLTLTGATALTATGNTLGDVLTSSTTGKDALIGSAHGANDTFNVNFAGDTVTESGNGTANLVNSVISFTLGANLEDLTLTGTGHGLIATGNAVSDVLSDATTGSGGNTLIGNSATNGTDTFVVNTATDVVSEHNAGTSTALIKSDVSWSLGTHTTNVNSLTLITGTGAGTGLTATGGALAGTITDATTAGGNTLTAGAGHATMVDASTGGDDIFNVNSTSDTVSALHGTTGAVNSTVNWTLGATHFDALTLTGTGTGLTATGNTSSDILTDNTTGAGGNTLIGGSITNSSDTFNVNAAGDTVSETNFGTNTALINSDVSFNLATHATNVSQLTLTAAGISGTAAGSGHDTITGSTLGGDTITDSSSALAANSDTLTGRSTLGGDTFMVNNTADSVTETGSATSSLISSSVNFVLGATGVTSLTLTGTATTAAAAATGHDTITGNIHDDTLTDSGATGGTNTGTH